MNAYQVVTDTVTGVNVRGSDNLIQLLVVVVTTIIGIIVGAIVNHESLMLIGLFGFGGLVIGILFSGAVIGTDASKTAYASPVNGKFMGKTMLVVGLKKTF